MRVDERISIDVNGQRREFLFRLPEGAEPRPLVVMLHGKGGTGAWAADETGWDACAARYRFAIAYPEGEPPNPYKPAKFLTNPPSWHDGSLDNTDQQKQETDLPFLSAMLNEITTRYAINDRRIFFTGFSNGAGMTFAAAAALTNRIAAIAPVAGHCWNEYAQLARAIPTFYLVGDRDPLIPINGGAVATPWGKTQYKPSVAETLSRWSRAVDRPISSFSLEADEDVTALADRFEIEPFVALTIRGQGHHWPGGKGKLSHQIGGPNVSPINACELIWSFFQSVPDN